jgi:uncharacterized protein YoxC
MTIEISVAIIALTLLVSMICALAFLWKTRKLLDTAKKDLHHLSTQAIDLIQKAEVLVSDLQAKSESLDVVFRPLKAIRKGKHPIEASETVSEIVEWVGTSLSLFQRLRSAFKRREK